MNQEINAKMKAARVYRWEVAEKLGISEPTFYRWMRRELAAEKREQVLCAINEILKERNNGEGV